ncbi:MAG: M23 family metallopeptidase [Ruminococcaceae bacterium]|nr:M23 family metallopeptidase [Oscillospiraceae bacterium]
MKKNIIIALCIIALFIPTFCAVGYYISAQKSPVAERTVESLTLTDVEGNNYVFDKKSDESKEVISFFIEMNDGAERVDELPDQLKENKYYEAKYRSHNKDKVYKYYFTTNPNEAYYIDAQRKVYSIDSEKAIDFLMTEYAASLYETAKEPELKVSNMSELKPYSINWRYKAGAGEFVSTSYKGTQDKSAKYPVSGSLMLDFSNQPDYVTVKITEGDKVIFNDIYEKLSPSDIGETTKAYNVEVNAKWYEADGKEYCGEAKYIFTANVSAPASFYLGENTIEQGEFVVLTGKNVTDVNSIVFKSEPEINFTPVFYKEGDFVVALIPISLDLEYSPAYNFTISSGGVTEELTLTVSKRPAKGMLYSDIEASIVNRTRNDSILSAFEAALKSTVDKNETTRYWNDLFIEPVNRSIQWGFGRTVELSSVKQTFVNKGVDYIVVQTDKVCAVNAGKVAYVGEQTYSGKLVVIDHGFGLKSWYMNMSEISVQVGDKVEKGAELGVVGNTGFANGVKLHYEITVNGVHVCPYSLEDEGIKMYIGG